MYNVKENALFYHPDPAVTLLFETSSNPCAFTDFNGTILRANPAFTAMSGVEEGALPGKELRRLVAPGSEERFEGSLATLRERGSARVEGGCFRLGGEGGRRFDWSGCVVAENLLLVSLHESSSLDALFGVRTFAVLIDDEGRIVDLNPFTESLLGWSREEARGMAAAELWAPPESRDEYARLFSSAEPDLPSPMLLRSKEGRGVYLALSRYSLEQRSDGRRARYLAGVDLSRLMEEHQRLREAEERSRHVTSLACDILVIHRNNKILAIQGKESLLGEGGGDAIIGREISEFIPGEIWPLVEARLQLAAKGELLPFVEYQVVTADGRVIDVEISSARVSYRGEVAIQSFFRDISERKRSAALLQARERFFETLTRVVPVGIFQTDPEGRLVYMNDRLRDILGRPESPVVELWARAAHGEQERVREAWHHAMERGQPFRTEFCVAKPGGGEAWVEAHALPEQGAEGEPRGYVGVLIDITRVKRDEYELSQYRERLEEMVEQRTEELAMVNHELESFSYSVSHDLRAPLRSINGFANALWEDYRDRIDPEALFYLSRIRANSRHMADLVENLLEFARVAKAELTRERVDLTIMAQSIIAELAASSPARHVSVEIAPDLCVLGDRKLLQTMLQNLLENAWKYTGKSTSPHIELGAREVGGVRVFYVKDNGAGFDMECAENLFRPFTRLHLQSEFEGTGVGLATVQRIVNRHGGRIWAEAEEGRGATFYFVLAASADGSPCA